MNEWMTQHSKAKVKNHNNLLFRVNIIFDSKSSSYQINSSLHMLDHIWIQLDQIDILQSMHFFSTLFLPIYKYFNI